MESKYCPKCGAENKANAKFCVKCGMAFNVEPSTQVNTSTPTEKDSTIEKKDDEKGTLIWGLISLIVIAIIAVGGVKFGHSFYLNHRSEQKTADLAQDIADDDFGENEVQITYSKADNAFTVSSLSGSSMRDNLDDFTDDYGDQDKLNDISSNYKQFIADLYSHMGSHYKSYYACIENPWDHSRVFMDSTGNKVSYDGLEN